MFCRKPILHSDQTYMRRETKIGWFRGDDEVEYAHCACLKEFNTKRRKAREGGAR